MKSTIRQLLTSQYNFGPYYKHSRSCDMLAIFPGLLATDLVAVIFHTSWAAVVLVLLPLGPYLTRRCIPDWPGDKEMKMELTTTGAAMMVVVLSDGETYSEVEGCYVTTVPAEYTDNVEEFLQGPDVHKLYIGTMLEDELD